MHAPHPPRPMVLAAVLVLAAVAGALGGCSREARYKVLTFFFTGVPPLESEGKAAPAEAGAKAPAPGPAQAPASGTAQAPTLSAAEKARLTRAQIELQRRAAFRRAIKWTHGPYGAGRCDLCHSLAGSLSFRIRTPAAGRTRRPVRTATRRLRVPVEELCQGCHTSKSTETADALGVRLHGPVAAGMCVACHSPHDSPRRYMLIKPTNVELCTQCHDAAALHRRTPVHKDPKGADCLACHNPHMGRSAMLLKSEFDESQAY